MFPILCQLLLALRAMLILLQALCVFSSFQQSNIFSARRVKVALQGREHRVSVSALLSCSMSQNPWAKISSAKNWLLVLPLWNVIQVRCCYTKVLSFCLLCLLILTSWKSVCLWERILNGIPGGWWGQPFSWEETEGKCKILCWSQHSLGLSLQWYLECTDSSKLLGQ